MESLWFVVFLLNLVESVLRTDAGLELQVGHIVHPHHAVSLPVAVDPGHSRACGAVDDCGVWIHMVVALVVPDHLDDPTRSNAWRRTSLRVALNIRVTVPLIVVGTRGWNRYCATRSIFNNLANPGLALQAGALAELCQGTHPDLGVTLTLRQAMPSNGSGHRRSHDGGASDDEGDDTSAGGL